MRKVRLTDSELDIFKRAANVYAGGVNWFTKYYFNRELVPWQFYFHHAKQLDITVIGGVGSGKTTGAGLSAAVWAASTPRFAFMNLAPTAWQSRIMYEIILREAADNPFEKFIVKATSKPYPVIVLKNPIIGESKLYFMSAADDARRIQGIEVDTVNIDEAGQILNPFQLMGMVSSRMRGNVPIGRGRVRPRLKRLSMTTASYLEAPPWLWARMDAGLTDPKNFLSMSVKSASAGTLSEEDIELYKRRIPPDQQAALMDAEKPLGAGEHFNLQTVSQCEDMELNRNIQYHLLEKDVPSKGWRYEEAPGVGCVHYEKPQENGRQYLLIGDPGQGNPPKRNAAVVIVLDITGFPNNPCEVVYFDWVFGHGSYEPFKASYSFAWKKYRPINALVDNTGTQALWDEQIFLNMGIWVDGVNFSGLKNAMLTSLIQLIQRQKIRFPYIQGFRSQLIGYSIAKDNKIAQDIVAALMMGAFYLRRQLWQEIEEKIEADAIAIPYSSARYVRGTGKIVYTPRMHKTQYFYTSVL